jgi:hypothetical protein
VEDVTAWVADDQYREAEESARPAIAGAVVLLACLAAMAAPAIVSVLALLGWFR